MGAPAIKDSRDAAAHPVVELVRELTRAYQAFAAFDGRVLKSAGLTQPQADVVFTLGNTEGMSCRELGERTLITKGTLTGVLDRLERKGLVRRRPSREDRRVIRVSLTPRGQRLFEGVFPGHIRTLAERIADIGEDERAAMLAALRRLRKAF